MKTIPSNPQDEMEDAINQAVGFITIIEEWVRLGLEAKGDPYSARQAIGLLNLAESTSDRLQTAFDNMTKST